MMGVVLYPKAYSTPDRLGLNDQTVFSDNNSGKVIQIQVILTLFTGIYCNLFR